MTEYKTIDQIRAENLQRLLHIYNTTNIVFAEKVKTNPCYISQILSDDDTKNMGGNLARGIEKALNLAPGWMDNRHHIKAPLTEETANE